MIFKGSKNLEVIEYDLTSITKALVSPIIIANHPSLIFNKYRLSIAIARTICSEHLDKKEYWSDMISSLLGLWNIIDNKKQNLRIKSSRIERLRDFSRTSRIGEIAQGIVWLYMQDNGYPYITDFHFFAMNKGINIPRKASTPDFVGQDSNLTNEICLAESKGKESRSSGIIKAKLARALKQCNSSENIILGSHFNVVKKLGFCTEFSDENDTNNSTLHFVDPEKDSFHVFYDDTVMRFHYASWFYLIGDFSNAELLLSNEPIKWKKHNFDKEIIDEIEYWVLNKSKNDILNMLKGLESKINRIIYSHLMDVVTFGISASVVKMLENIKQIKNIQIDYVNKSTEEYELFIDGTIILKR